MGEVENKALPKARRASKGEGNQPRFELRKYLYEMMGVDLTQIDGISAYTALVVVSEIGTDMSAWESSKQFGSWLCLSPGSKKSGGKQLSTKSKPGANRVANQLRMSAQALSNSQSALGGYYRRMKARLGGPKAITATAYKLASVNL